MELLRNISLCLEYISQTVILQPEKFLASVFFTDSKVAIVPVRSSSLSMREKLLAVHIVAFMLLAAEFFVFPLLSVQAAVPADHIATVMYGVSSTLR